MSGKIGFVFDWDGVIVDSSRQHEESWDVISERHGLPLFDGHFKLGFGKRNEQIIPDILKWAQEPADVQRLADEKEAAYREIVARSGLQPLPGVPGFLDTLIGLGLRRVVGSSTPHKNIEAVMDIIGLTGKFEAVVAAEDVARGKPDPEVFLKAAGKIATSPENCVVFEDSFSGIEAGLAAGMTVVGIATTNPIEALRASGVHLAVNSFEELEPRALMELASR